MSSTPTRRCHQNPFGALEVSRHVSWAPLNPDFEGEPLPPEYTFFSSFPGEIRNAIYAYLLDVPKDQDVFGHELTLTSEKRLPAVILPEYARKIGHLVHLGMSCKVVHEEISSLLGRMVEENKTLVVRLDILQNSSFNLKSALENLERHRSGEDDVFKLLEKATLRIIWPQDNLEWFYLGTPDFFKDLPCPPKRIQMEIPCGPWNHRRGSTPLGCGDCAFLTKDDGALFHPSSALPMTWTIKDKKKLKIFTFERRGEQTSQGDLGELLREQCRNWLVENGRWLWLRGSWETFGVNGDWWDKNKEEVRKNDGCGNVLDREGIREIEERWYAKHIAPYLDRDGVKGARPLLSIECFAP